MTSSTQRRVSRLAWIFASSFLVMVTAAIVASFIDASSNEHGSMSILPKDCLAVWENLAEMEETRGSEQVVAIRQERLPHSFKTTGLSVSSTIDRAFSDLEQKRRPPIEDRGLRFPSETVLCFSKVHARIEFLHELPI